MKITIGCDHAGVGYKSKIVEFLKKEDHKVLDVGTKNFDASPALYNFFRYIKT